MDEPAGFANTYHTWRGPEGGSIVKASNWSHYVYENAGITYMREDGPPQAHWSAKIGRGSALADEGTEFLGLEVAGVLKVNAKVAVRARNELRVTDKGRMVLQGGRLESLRWVDVREGGTLAGHGAIHADLYARGALLLRPDKPLVVEGAAKLSGTLALAPAGKGFSGPEHTILQANSISGKFENNEVTLGGTLYAIKYSATQVTISAK